MRQLNQYNTAQPPRGVISKPPMPIIQPQPPSATFSATFQPANQPTTQITLSSAPKLYAKPSAPTIEAAPVLNIPAGPSIEPNNSLGSGGSLVNPKVIKKAKTVDKTQNTVADEIIKAAKASSALQSFGGKDKKKINKKTTRQAGGQTWEDPSLCDWPDDDFRIFCGDLGNDVTDEALVRTFNKFPSFQRAKVIRDRRTNKSKGYGFISFGEPQDFIRAMKEMDGRYVGTRPIKLRKSNWKSRSIDERKKKDAEKKAIMATISKH